jgi:hypothetical protein
MTSEGLGEMFEVDSPDLCAGIFPLVSMSRRVEGLAGADQGARTPIGDSRNLYTVHTIVHSFYRWTALLCAQLCTLLHNLTLPTHTMLGFVILLYVYTVVQSLYTCALSLF